jgi:hypothetical protein
VEGTAVVEELHIRVGETALRMAAAVEGIRLAGEDIVAEVRRMVVVVDIVVEAGLHILAGDSVRHTAAEDIDSEERHKLAAGEGIDSEGHRMLVAEEDSLLEGGHMAVGHKVVVGNLPSSVAHLILKMMNLRPCGGAP